MLFASTTFVGVPDNKLSGGTKMRIPNQSLGVVRQSKVRYHSATTHMHGRNEAIVPQARMVGLGGLGDVWDCIICTAVCSIFTGDIVNCEQACRASGCMEGLKATLG
jgi:hypothetical protein